jgi:Ser/Thr protein kinase RdoA (MazF antagonist)
MGKPKGNGHPVACVATSFEIISAFRHAYRYFNTFGGNPVSCAAASAVLDVLRDEDLPAKTAATGNYLRAGVATLAEKHAMIGDIRGSGLAIGVELVLDRTTRAPATEMATSVINSLRRNGVLIGANGIHYNVPKIRPPMQFGPADADLLLQTMNTGHAVILDLAREAASHRPEITSAPVLVMQRENAVFRVETLRGHHALRLHREGYRSDAALASELDWMAMFTDRGMKVPAPMASRNGRYLVALARGRRSSLLSWLPGKPMGESRRPLDTTGAARGDLFRGIGRQITRMHRLTDAWTLPQGFQRPRWDLEGLVGEAPFWGRFWTIPASAEDRALLTATSFDLATTIVKNMDESDAPDLEAALLEGYQAERPLGAEDLDLLPFFLTLRALTDLGWVQDRMQDPGSPVLAERFLRVAKQVIATRLG